jgi:hypothetical protein
MSTKQREEFDLTLEGSPTGMDPDDVPESVIEEEMALFTKAAGNA